MNDASKNTQMPMVGVVMSTYNGEKFLAEQLDSILCQKGVDVRLVVRDDGSKDATVDILNRYAAQHGNMTVLARPNVGCKQSFCEAAREAADLLPDCDYFAFADQDDVWLDDKLASEVDALAKNDAEKPALAYCQYQLVDASLGELPTRRIPNRDTLAESLVISSVPGCTMAFNRKLMELFLMARPEKMTLHDNWIFKTCLACGGKVSSTRKIGVLYRQHGHNEVGADSSLSHRAKLVGRNVFAKHGDRSWLARNILETYSDEIAPNERRTLAQLADYRKGLNRFKVIFSDAYRTNRPRSNRMFKLYVLLGKY